MSLATIRFSLLTAMVSLLPFSGLEAGKVLWDVSHGCYRDYDLERAYSQLAELLVQQGYEVESGEDPINIHGLWDVDILVCSVLSNYLNSYGDAEVERIVPFVDGGGGLIVLSDISRRHPDNIRALLAEFGLLAARNDNISRLSLFDDLPLFQGIDSVALPSGSAVDTLEGGGARLAAFDTVGLAGIAVNLSRRGAVILIGDSDVWTNAALDQADNRTLALNCFASADRQRLGRFECDLEGGAHYLPQGLSWDVPFSIGNSGQGPLEVGCRVAGEPGWLACSLRYAVIEPDESLDYVIALNAGDLPVDTTVTTTVFIDHNDPEAQPVEAEFAVHVVSLGPQHFQSPGPTGGDHSLLVRGVTIEGEPAGPGFELGVFMPDGFCAGAAVYSGVQVGIAARADNPLTPEVDGFLEGEPFTFRLYLPWSESEIGAAATWLRGPDRFRCDGLTVLSLDARPAATLELVFERTWNLVSLNLTPPTLDLETIFAPLVDGGLLVIVKDGEGRFWFPARDFNNLGEWNPLKGYTVRVADTTRLELGGVELDPGMAIPLPEGWSLAPFLPQQPQPLEPALASIWDNLCLIKREEGSFAVPRWDWDGIGELVPGEGYKVLMAAADTLVYPAEIEQRRGWAAARPDRISLAGGRDMSLLVVGLPPGIVVRVVTADGCSHASGVADLSGRAGLALPGDDPDTPVREGLTKGERFHIQVGDGGRSGEPELVWIEGEAVYSDDGLLVARFEPEPTARRMPDLLCLTNPFNERLTLRLPTLPEGVATVAVYDVEGRMLAVRSISGVEGACQVTFDSRTWQAGPLIVVLDTGGSRRVVKAVHLP